MKIDTFIATIILSVFLLTSCKEEKKAPNYKKMEFHIKGMTCEIGCARLIESKLSKTEGIRYSKVSFKDSLALVEYDSNALSQKEINSVVDNIADGKLYKSSENKIVTEFREIQ